MMPGHSSHAQLSRRHSDAATGLTVPENVLRLPRGPDTTSGRGFNPGFRTNHYAQWTNPNINRFQNKGRSGSVPTVVLTGYQHQRLVQQHQQAYQHHMEQQQQQPMMDPSMNMEQVHMEAHQQEMYAPIPQPIEAVIQEITPAAEAAAAAEHEAEAEAAPAE
jgi:hypothetical protein